MKLVGAVAVWPSGFVRTTLTKPALCAGVVTLTVVELATLTTEAAEPPKLTVAPAWKFSPAMVTAVPPLVTPAAGEMTVMEGDDEVGEEGEETVVVLLPLLPPQPTRKTVITMVRVAKIAPAYSRGSSLLELILPHNG